MTWVWGLPVLARSGNSRQRKMQQRCFSACEISGSLYELLRTVGLSGLAQLPDHRVSWCHFWDCRVFLSTCSDHNKPQGRKDVHPPRPCVYRPGGRRRPRGNRLLLRSTLRGKAACSTTTRKRARRPASKPDSEGDSQGRP